MVKLTIIYPTDPFGKKAGGVETCVKDIIKYAPPDFNIEFIGVTMDEKERPLRRWTSCRMGDRRFEFYPLCRVDDEDKKTLIPLSLRFTVSLGLSRIDLRDRVILLNRIEPALALMHVHSPKVGSIHNDIQQQINSEKSENLWSKAPWLYFMIEGIIFRSLNHVYTVSQNTLEFYWKRYSNKVEKFSFWPTWADGDIYSPAADGKASLRTDAYFVEKMLPSHKKWVLYVGRLQKQKAPRRLVDTFFKYHKKDNNSCLIVVGDGNLKSDVEKYIKELRMKNDIFLFRTMPKEELVRFYRASDALLLTSNVEGMPRCVIEALSCGLPVISTNVGEARLVVKNGFSGELIDSFLPVDIAEGIEKVLNNPNIYSQGNCIKSVSPYRPQIVLAPIFERLKNLYYSSLKTGLR